MITNCPVCGKLTCIHWPEHWVYKRGKTYYCSEQCLDVSVVRDTKTLTELHRRRKELVAMANGRRYIKPEERDEALELYNDSGKQAAINYLTKIGIPNPEKCLKNLKARIVKTAPAHTVKVDVPLKNDTYCSEQNDVIEQEPPTRIIRKMFGFEVSAIRDEVFGEFYYDIKYNRIDWRSPEGEEVSLSPSAWQALSQKIPAVLNALGVKL